MVMAAEEAELGSPAFKGGHFSICCSVEILLKNFSFQNSIVTQKQKQNRSIKIDLSNSFSSFTAFLLASISPSVLIERVFFFHFIAVEMYILENTQVNICQRSRSHCSSLILWHEGTFLWWTRSINVVNVVGNSPLKFKYFIGFKCWLAFWKRFAVLYLDLSWSRDLSCNSHKVPYWVCSYSCEIT